jgi:hypothetical protein
MKFDVSGRPVEHSGSPEKIIRKSHRCSIFPLARERHPRTEGVPSRWLLIPPASPEHPLGCFSTAQRSRSTQKIGITVHAPSRRWTARARGRKDQRNLGACRKKEQTTSPSPSPCSLSALAIPARKRARDTGSGSGSGSKRFFSDRLLEGHSSLCPSRPSRLCGRALRSGDQRPAVAGCDAAEARSGTSTECLADVLIKERSRAPSDRRPVRRRRALRRQLDQAGARTSDQRRSRSSRRTPRGGPSLIGPVRAAL